MITRTVLLGAIILSIFVAPTGTAYAAYTYRGETFATYEEYTAFVAEYLRVWRELQGETTTVSTRTPSSGGGGGGGAIDTTTTNGGGGGGGTDTVTSATKSAIPVTTGLAMDIEHDNARTTGSFDIRRGHYATVWFEYGYSSTRLTEISDYHTLRSFGGSTRFDARIRGLAPQTRYYYRAVVKTSDGREHYGTIRSFATPVNYDSTVAVVSVRTDPVRDVDDNRATLRARVTFNDAPYTNVWFLYGDGPDDLHVYTGRLRVAANGDRYHDVEYVFDDLDPNTTYYVRAVVQDHFGQYAYGDIRSFTTRADILNQTPTIDLGRTTDVTPYSAAFSADVDMNDGEDGIVFVIYGENRDVLRRVMETHNRYADIRERGDELQKVLLSTGVWEFQEFDYMARDLEPNTRYYFAVGVEYRNEFRDRVMLYSSMQSLSTRRL